MTKPYLKYINRLSRKEQVRFWEILKKIELNDFENLDIKKLRGANNLYRVRVGKLRIIFLKGKKNKIDEILPRGDVY
jgi:mRNA interferase RelE/StbE